MDCSRMNHMSHSFRRIRVAVFLSSSLLLLAPLHGQGLLKKVTAVPSDSTVGAGAFYKISFITDSTGVGLPANGKIRLTFPASFTDSTISAAFNVSGLNGGYSGITDTNHVVTLSRDGTGTLLAAGDTAVFSVAIVYNPTIADSFRILVETLTVADTLIDSARTAYFKIVPGPLHHFKIDSVATQTAGVPFNLMLSARDFYENVVKKFKSKVFLSANVGVVDNDTSGAFVNGLRTEPVRINLAGTGRVITARDSLNHTGSSNAFTVNPAGLHHFTIDNISNPQTAGGAFALTMAAKDSFENTITGFVGTVSITDSTGTISPSVSGSFSAGTKTETVRITQARNNNRITVANAGKTGLSNSFNVNVGALARFSIDSVPDQIAGNTFTLSITAQDANGNTVTSFGGTVNLTDNTGTLDPPVSGTFNSGVRSQNVSIEKAQSGVLISLNDGAGHLGQSNSFTVSHNNLDHFVVTSTDGSLIPAQEAGSPFNIQIEARDVFDNTVTSFSGAGSTVTLSNTTSSISPTTSNTFSSGILNSQPVTISTSSAADAITASNSGRSGTSNSFAVTTGALAGFEIEAIASPQAAGVPFPILVKAVDASGNVVPSYSGTVDISITGGGINPTTSPNFVQGAWNGAVTVSSSGTGKVITVTNGAFSQNSNAFDVSSGALDHFGISQIDPQVAGQTFTFVVTAEDASDNPISFTGTVSLSDITGTLSTTSVVFNNEASKTVEAFITKAQPGNVITAGSSSKSGRSNSFTVSHAALDHFAITAVPSGNIGSQTAGAQFNIRIIAQDQFNNTVATHTGPSSPVVLSNLTGSITPGASGPFNSGVLPSQPVTIRKTSNADAITVIGGSPSRSGTSNNFAVTHGTLANFSIAQIPSPQTAGAPFPLVVKAIDANDNTVTSFNGTVDLSVSGGGLNPTTSTSFIDGIWNGSVTISNAGTGRIITVTNSSISVDSNPFDVGAGNLDHFAIAAIGPQIAGQNFSVTVTARDANNNNVAYSGTVTLIDNTNTLSASSLVFSNQATQTINDANITKAQGNVIIFANGSGRSGQSAPFAVGHAPLDHFVVTSTSGGTIGSQTAGIPFAIRIVARDQFDNKVTGFNSNVSIVDQTNLNTTSDLFTNGELLSQSLTLEQARSDNFLTVSGGSPTANGVSNLFNVNHAPLHHFEFDPISDQAAGEPFTITMRARDEFNNLVTSFASAVTITDLTTTISPNASDPFIGGVRSQSVTISQTRLNDIISVTGLGKSGESNSFDVQATTVDHFEISAVGNQIAGQQFSVTVTARDASNNIVTDFSSTVNVSDLSNSIQPTVSNPFSSGQLVQNFIITKSFTNNHITFSGVGRRNDSNPFNVSHAPLSRFSIENIQDQTAGVGFPLNMTALDAFDNTVTSFVGTVTISINSGTIDPAVSTPFSAGTKSMGVTVPEAGSNRIITVNDGSGHLGSSNAFAVTASGLHHFVISQIATQVAGSPFSFVIAAQDANDNDVSFTGTVNLRDVTTTLQPTSIAMSGTSVTVSNAVITKAQSGVFITVSGGGKSNPSNLFDVNPGALSRVRIAEGTSGKTNDIGDRTLNADLTLTMHAAGYDAFGNYRSDEAVNWSVLNGIGTVNPSTNSISSVFSATKVGTGRVVADHATAIDDSTGVISVTPGDSYSLKIMTQASGETSPVTTASLTTGGTLEMHASSFDRDDNYTGDVSVSWFVTGGIGTLSVNEGVTTIFTATTEGDGQITADHATLLPYSTGTIEVNSGNLAYVRIVEGTTGAGNSIGSRTLRTDGLLTVHAAGYDASDNFVGDQSVTWLVRNGIGVVSPAFGATTEFDPRVPGPGRLVADHATANDDSAAINVDLGAAFRVKVLEGLSGLGNEVFDVSLQTGQTLQLHASSYDRDNNRIEDVVVNWRMNNNIGTLNPTQGSSTTFTAVTAGNAIITADHASLEDGRTGTITVASGALNYVKIVRGPSGHGAELGDLTQTTDDVLEVHAAGYDVNNNYLGDYDVDWTVSGGIGVLNPTQGKVSSLTFNRKGLGKVYATHATAADDSSGLITVNAGVLNRIKVLSAEAGNTPEIPTQTTTTITADQNLPVHAGGFDADNNYIADYSVNWSVSGGIGALSAQTGIATTLNANRVGTGQITATYDGSLSAQTGIIEVRPGALSYVKVVRGSAGHGAELEDHTMSTDNDLTLHAAGYDADNNYRSDEPVTWSSTGTLEPAVSATGLTYVFRPTKAPGSGIIRATHATAGFDETGTITVTAGLPSRVKIMTQASGNTSPITTASLTTGGTLEMHASSFDNDDNYVGDVNVIWSVTGGIGTLSANSGVTTIFTAVTEGTGQITADHASLVDYSTQAIQVNAGSLAYVRIVEGTTGPGNPIGSRTLKTDGLLTVHAAGYDASNNFVGDQSVTWLVRNGIGAVSPSFGAATEFDPRVPGPGRLVADHATANDDSAAINVELGAAFRVRILEGLTGLGNEVFDVSLQTGQTLDLHASSYDRDNNRIEDVVVSWRMNNNIGTLNPTQGSSTRFTAVTAGNAIITADHASLEDGRTGTITVASGTLNYVKIVRGPSGHGAELGDLNQTTDDVLEVHAAGYDVNNNYLGDFNVDWSVSNGIGVLSVTQGKTTSLNLTKPRSGKIYATHASAAGDSSGVIGVGVGALYRIKVLSADAGETPEIPTQTTTILTADENLPVHTGGFDADNNYIGDLSVSWSVSGGIGSLSSQTGIATTLNANKVGTGQITATYNANLSAQTGIIEVRPGALSYIKVVRGSAGHGPELGNHTMKAGADLTLHAAGYDAEDNYVSDQSVTWSSAGTLEPPVSGTGLTHVFHPTKAPRSGIIRATHESAGSDTTGTITVNVGDLNHILVLTGLSGETSPQGPTTLNPGQTLELHAGGFDAQNNYISGENVSWSVDGDIGTLSTPQGISTTFTAMTVGSGSVRADHQNPLIPDANTGTITVNTGNVASIILRSGPNNSGGEIRGVGLNADQQITIYAAGYDAGGNYFGDVQVAWSSTGNLTPPVSGTSSSITFSPIGAAADGSVNGTIVGTYPGGISDATGTIIVGPGSPKGNVILTPNPEGLSADGVSTAQITSSVIKDGDNNDVGPGRSFTVAVTPSALGQITTPDADDEANGHQIKTNDQSRLDFTFMAGTSGGAATINVTSGLQANGYTIINLGSLSIVSVTTSPTTVTRGQTGINVSMSVKNLGPAPIQNVSAGLTFFGTIDRTTDYTVTTGGNPTSIAGNAQVTFSFNVAVSSTAALETITIDGLVNGTVNGTPVSSNQAGSTDSWNVVRPANVVVESVNTSSETVQQSQNDVAVTVRVANNLGVGNTAAATIDSVRLKFSQGAADKTGDYVIAPRNHPTTILGGSFQEFNFSVNVGVSASLGNITIDARAHGRDANSGAATNDLDADAKDQWAVVASDAFRITAIIPSQDSVTTGMTREWQVRMVVQNTSTSNIALDLTPAKTNVRFVIGTDVTDQYDIGYPTLLQGGGIILEGSSIDTLKFTIRRTGTKDGVATIMGMASGEDLSTGLDVTANTNISGAGEVLVERQGALEFREPVTTSQPAVTAGQVAQWLIRARVTNGGESRIKLLPDSTVATVGSNPNYTFDYPRTFADGDSILERNETKLLEITVTRTPAQLQTETLPITVRMKGTELNSLRRVASNIANGGILVQTPASLEILQVRASRSPVTAGQFTTWYVTAVVHNSGASSVTVKTDTSTNLRFRINGQFQSGYTANLQPPNWLRTSSKVLGGNSTDTLRFAVSPTGTTPGSAQLWVKVAAVEDNSNAVRVATDNGSTAVQVQLFPEVSYISSSLRPDVVNYGNLVGFSVRVHNNGGATVELNRNLTRFIFTNDVVTYTSLLDGNRVTRIPPGDTTLTFVQVAVPPGMPVGRYTPKIELRGTHNGNSFIRNLDADANELQVSSPAKVQVVGVRATQTTVTAGMTKPWEIVLALANNGGSNVVLDSIDIQLYNGGVVTGDFDIVPPSAFQRGSTILAPAVTDSLRFSIGSTGPRPGATSVVCQVWVIDQSNGDRLHAPSDGTSGSFIVQNQAALSILSLRPSQTNVTASQTQQWHVDMSVKNLGGSEVQVDFTPTQTRINFAQDASQYDIGFPNSLFEGGNRIQGDSTRTLRFTIRATGSQLGDNTITGIIRAIELNSDVPRTDDTQSGGATSVTVETAAKLQIASTQYEQLESAPNLPYVNTGQAFRVKVTLTNLGGENADDVRVRLVGDGSSTFVDGSEKTVIGGVPGNKLGNQLRSVTFTLSASSSENPREIFRSFIVAGIGHNTGTSVQQETPRDDTTSVVIQTPADIRLVEVTPSISTADALSNVAWEIYALVKNTGSAAFTFNPPKPSDLVVRIDGEVQTDYSIGAPDTLESNGTLTLRANQQDRFVYRVISTGRRGGTATLQVTLSGEDVNTGLPASNITQNGQIQVVAGAAIKVARTEPIVKNFFALSGVGLVNTEQDFSVEVTVDNPGFEDVENIEVQLVRDGESQILTPVRSINLIEVQKSGSVRFDVRGASSPTPSDTSETFSARILRGTASQSGGSAKIFLGNDTTARVLVQWPAKLKLTAQVADVDLTTNQEFKVTANVTNRAGAAAVNTDGRMSLFVPEGFRLESDQEQAFVPGPSQTVTWDVTAPPDARENVPLTVRISTIPLDQNAKAPAVVAETDTAKTINVTVIDTDLRVSSLSFVEEGARDGIVSSSQEFTLSARITTSDDLDPDDQHVRISIPTSLGYVLIGGQVDVSPIPASKEVQWQIKAPPNARRPARFIVVKAEGKTGTEPVFSSDSLTITTVREAVLSLKAEIISPSGATKGDLSAGQIFDVRASVTNGGDAAVKAPAKVLLQFGNTGVTTEEALEDTLVFSGNLATKVWRLRAPNVPTPQDSLTFELTELPVDENTLKETAWANEERKGLDRIAVRTDSVSHVIAFMPEITKPFGATDKTLSTDQEFVVQARLDAYKLFQPRVELQYPIDFVPIGQQAVQAFQDIVGDTTIQWTLKAPATSRPLQQIHVRVTALDKHSLKELIALSLPLQVEVVSQAKLSLKAGITAPDNAKDGIVSTDQIFEVTATAQNEGQARFLRSDSVRIEMTLPNGYSTMEPLIKKVLIGNTTQAAASWLVRAPREASREQSISFQLKEPFPFDENSEKAPTEPPNPASVLVETENKTLYVTDLRAFDGGPVARNQQGLPMMTLYLANGGDAGSSNILLKSLNFHFRDRDGEEIAPNSAISGLKLVHHRNPTKSYGSAAAIAATNPVSLHLANYDTLHGGAPDTVDVLVDVASNASARNFYLSLLSEDDVGAEDQDSPDTKVTVVLSENGISSKLAVLFNDEFDKSFFNYPNPFRPGKPTTELEVGTRFNYFLEEDSEVELRIYTLLGELVYSASYKSTDPQGKATLAKSPNGGGGFLEWDGKNGDGLVVLNGVYLAVLKTKAGTLTTKVAVVK